MLLWILLVCFNPTALGELEETQITDDIDLTEFELDIVRHV